MHVSYAPKNKADGDPREWDIDLGDIPSDAAELIEAHFGAAWLQFEDAVRKGATLAKRLLLWHLMRTDHPTVHINLKDVPTFTHKELKIEASSDELQEMRALFLKSPQFKAVADREAAIAQVDVEIVEALEREGKTPPSENVIDGATVGGPAPLDPAVPALVASPSSTPTADQSPAISSSSPSPTFGGATGSPSPATASTTGTSGG